MSDKENNVTHHDWGYEITWAKHINYSGKILVFSNPGSKTPFFFNAETDKSFFVNSGSFKLRWISTEDGKIYENDLEEGQVWDCSRLVPCSLQALAANSSISVVSSGELEDKHIIIRPESF